MLFTAGRQRALLCAAARRAAVSTLAPAPCPQLLSRCFSTAATPAPSHGVLHYAALYGALSKFKLSGFVVSTSVAGFLLGSGEVVDWQRLGWTAAGTWGAAACANTLNQVAEVRNDGLMKRTRGRPLPSGAITRRHALLFAACTGVAGVSALYTQANPTTALLGVANVVLYAAAYTPLKQLTVANTWLGAVVGAIPPLMGWAASAGGLEPGAAVLAGLLYFWQLPHFMALAYLHRADYAAGGYRMLPLIDATGRRTALVALRNSLYMLPLGFAACALGVTTPPFAWEAAALSGCMAAGAAAFAASPSSGSARRLFLLSLVHLPVLQTACVVHRVPNLELAREQAKADTMAAWYRRTRERSHAEEVGREERMSAALLSGHISSAPFPFLPAPHPAAPARAQ